MRTATLLALAPFALALESRQTPRPAERSFGITTDLAKFAEQGYDYIIVGGGSAGLVLANRLSANPAYTVGVIEAGLYHPDEPLINVPGTFGRSLGNATFDWNIATTIQPGIHNRSLPQPRGKVLGGSSALTYHNYNRGSKQEYDAWAEMGNTGWDWDGIFPYFVKMDKVTPGDNGFLPGLTERPGTENVLDGATQGPITVTYNGNHSAITPYVAEWHKSWQNNGAYMNPDPEGGNSTGMTLTARPVDPVKGRVYSTNAYLEPALDRKNLFVLTGAETTKILFANATGVNGSLIATGIEYGTPLNTSRYTATATREVILSAGSLKSPQLLELSGVGNRSLLESLGIETILDLPEVGENLQDHLEWNQDFLLKEDIPWETWDVYRNKTRDDEAWQEYQTNRTGIYNASPATLGFFPLQTFPDAFNVSELVAELDRELAAATLSPIRKKQFEIQRRHLVEGKVTQLEIAFLAKGGVAHSNYPVIPGRSYLTAITFLLRPYSTGNVHINSTDPFAAPLVDPRYNEFSFDWKVAAQWTKLASKVMLTDPIAQYVERPVQPPADTETLEQWDDFCREWTISVWHPVGSTSMAPREIGGVVDPKMVVYGTQNLRIVDAGSMPINIAAHTVATVYAMAEKMSDIIIADRRIQNLNANIRQQTATPSQ
ncbi:L-sorbose 1-dehydrogenase [Hypsizygus marmoreus]|uniref:L-sorbose 1-dehydrogenase n=1 Tax=Hypsizygus marmoreus TaxID=39966 RepID=A0A369JZ43_HYPMA|nr:L-sorbose 1-dehydrogenase [Hypsizygus marmoreus]